MVKNLLEYFFEREIFFPFEKKRFSGGGENIKMKGREKIVKNFSETPH